MKLTIPTARMARPSSSPDVIGRIEAVVIDELRQPVEVVPGVLALGASPVELALTSDLPLIPGSHLMVQVGDRHAPDASSRLIEVEVVACRKWIRGHEVRTRLVQGHMPRELLKAA